MTPKEIAQKHYPYHQFDECKMGCMRCDDEVCESQVIKQLKKLLERLEACGYSDFNAYMIVTFNTKAITFNTKDK
jgi:hypothetical protein